MTEKRSVEIFGAGCAVCDESIKTVREIACSSCDVIVLDMQDEYVARRAKDLGIQSVPAVVIDGVVADCCAGRGIDENALRAAGLGQSLA